MTAFKKILVTTDFSELAQRAFAPARSLAIQSGAKILLAYIEEDRIPPFTVEYAGAEVGQILESHRKQAAEALDRLAREEFAGQVEVETCTRSGIPHREIVHLAEREDVDLIIMATHGRGFITHALFGSTTERVVRHAPCPVLTVPGRMAA